MTTTQKAGFQHAPVFPDDDRFVPLAAELGADFAQRAERHDRENTFVSENIERLRQVGYLRVAVPEELGGLGASLRQTCYAQTELAKYCGSTALAVNMHVYITLAQSYSWRHGNEQSGRLLRRVADDGIVLMTSGGSDGLWPSGTAIKEEGGYRVNGRKVFCSLAPVADVLSTMALYDDPVEGPVVLALGIPMSAEGVEIRETWDTLGMRATSSHDVQLTNVFVEESRVVGRRPWGRNDPILRNALVHFAPTVASVYLGVAIGARDEVVRTLVRRKSPDGSPLVESPIVQRQVGEMDYKLQTAWWSLAGALNEIGEDYPLSEHVVNLVQLAKRQIVISAVEVVDLALEAVGGASYFKGSPLERAYRDVRAGKYHPFTPEKALLHAGRLALELPVDQVW